MYPLMLKLKGRKILFIGGGKIATRKILSVVRHCYPEITIISPAITREIECLVKKLHIKWINSHFDEILVEQDFFMAFVCTDDKSLNSKIAEFLKSRGTLVNVCDNKEISDFYTVASFTFEDVSISISTKGGSPEKSKKIKKLIQEALKQNLL